MNLGHRLLIIGGIVTVLSYMPFLLMAFGHYPTIFMKKTQENSEMYSVVSGEIAPLIQFLMYAGFSLLIAGVTYRFWRRKDEN